jgi:uncharacterized protein with NRDE domain
MCLILFAWQHHPDYRLVLAANRDEFYARPTAPADFWDEAPQVLAGRDLVGGGTWLGVTRGGRFAAVANVRDPSDRRAGTPSRGLLPLGFLRGSQPPAAFLAKVARKSGGYRGFNLLAGDRHTLAWYSNREGAVRGLPPGLYGLSNAALDTPWPKVRRGKAALAGLLSRGGPLDPEALFALLADRTRPPDGELPDTGVGLAWERTLAPAFIVGPDYGTRAATVLLVGRDGMVTFTERRFERDPGRWKEARHAFHLAA